MIVSRLFGLLLSKVILRGLPAESASFCLANQRARRACAFRFAYIFASHGPVLVPLLEALSGHVSLRWAMLALGVGSFTMMIAEVPGGMYADRVGPRRALRLGLRLMIGAMAGFFVLGVARSLSLDVSPPGTTWWPGVISMFALEIVMGVALALIHGADTVFFVGSLRGAGLRGLDDEAIEATGSAIRYYGTMIAVGIGTVVFSLAEVLDISRALKTQLQSTVFLLTFAAQFVALALLARLEDTVTGDQRGRAAVSWKGLAEAHRQLARRPDLFSQLWIYAWTLACALMTVYLFQSPLKSASLDLAQQTPLFIPLFVGVMILGWWICASGSLLFRSTIAMDDRQSGQLRQTMPALACLLVMTLLAVYPLSVLLTGSGSPARATMVLVGAAVGFLLSNLMRGYFEPFARTTLLRYSRESGLRMPASLISVFNIAQRAANFAGAVIFSLLLPHVGSESLEPALNAQRQQDTAQALLYTLAAIALIILIGILYSQISSHAIHRRRRPTCVVVGSYQEGFEEMLQFCEQLRERGHDVLHPPPEARIVSVDEGFARSTTDLYDDEGEIQTHVFRLIDQADVLVVFAPEGRVGTSAAMEVGYALRSGKPVLTTEEPTDVTIRSLSEVMK